MWPILNPSLLPFIPVHSAYFGTCNQILLLYVGNQGRAGAIAGARAWLGLELRGLGVRVRARARRCHLLT